MIDQWLTLNDITIKGAKPKIKKTKLPRNKITNRDIEQSQADIKMIFDHMSLVSHAIMIQKYNAGIINGKTTDQTRDG